MNFQGNQIRKSKLKGDCCILKLKNCGYSKTFRNTTHKQCFNREAESEAFFKELLKGKNLRMFA